jgi:hypothetical protein
VMVQDQALWHTNAADLLGSKRSDVCLHPISRQGKLTQLEAIANMTLSWRPGVRMSVRASKMRSRVRWVRMRVLDGVGWMRVEVSGERLKGGKGRRTGICILVVSECERVVVFGQADRKQVLIKEMETSRKHCSPLTGRPRTATLQSHLHACGFGIRHCLCTRYHSPFPSLISSLGSYIFRSEFVLLHRICPTWFMGARWICV